MGRMLIHEFRMRLKGVIGWGIGLILFGALYLFIFPEVEEAMATIADIPFYKAIGFSMATFEEFIGSVVLQFLPILLGVYGITTAARAVIGEEEDGTLELILAQPVNRLQIIGAKLISIAVSLIAILIITGAGDAMILAIIKKSVSTTVANGKLFLAVLSAWPVTMLIASMSVFLGTFASKRRFASMIATVILIASYFANSVSGMVDSLKNLKYVSLFHYYNTSADAFIDGQDWGDILVLLAAIVVFVGGSLVFFSYRNFTVGEWPWRRSRSAV